MAPKQRKQCPHGIERGTYCRECVLAEVKDRITGLVDECLDERSRALAAENARLRKENAGLQSFYALVPRMEKRLLHLAEALRAAGVQPPEEETP